MEKSRYEIAVAPRGREERRELDVPFRTSRSKTFFNLEESVVPTIALDLSFSLHCWGVRGSALIDRSVTGRCAVPPSTCRMQQ